MYISSDIFKSYNFQYRLNISVVIVNKKSVFTQTFLLHSRENVYRTNLLDKNSDGKSICTVFQRDYVHFV